MSEEKKTTKQKIAAMTELADEIRKETSFDKLESLSPGDRDVLKGKALAGFSIRVYINWVTKGRKTSTKKGAPLEIMTMQELADHIHSAGDVMGIDQQLVNCIEKRAEDMLLAQRKFTIEFSEKVLDIIED